MSIESAGKASRQAGRGMAGPKADTWTEVMLVSP